MHMSHKRPLPLNALRAFEAAARHLSIQGAAAELFVTSAAVSHQVKRLEEYLGVPLFHRGNRVIELTARGQSLARSCTTLFRQLETALEEVHPSTSSLVTVSTIESFAAKWLTPRLAKFQKLCPDVSVRVVTGDDPVDFARKGVDLAIRYGAGVYPEVEVERLMEAPAFPVCSPSLLAQIDLDDATTYTLLHDETSTGRGLPNWHGWLDVTGDSAAKAKIDATFPSLYLAQEAAAAGQGLALGLAPLVEGDLLAGRLVRPFKGHLRNAYAFWLLRPHASTRPCVDRFCDWLRSEASPQLPDQPLELAKSKQVSRT